MSQMDNEFSAWLGQQHDQFQGTRKDCSSLILPSTHKIQRGNYVLSETWFFLLLLSLD